MIKHALTLAHRGDIILIDAALQGNQIQPNAIDITCDHLYRNSMISSASNHKFVLSNDTTTHVVKEQVDPVDNYYKNLLLPVYYFESNLEITIPWGFVAWLVTRSSLNRNGIRVESGLYDAGFKGKIAGTLYNHSGVNIDLQRGARVAQLVFAEAETLHKYDGQYQST